MQPKHAAIILAYTTATMAWPLGETNSQDHVADYVEHFREPAKISGDTLVWYGPPDNSTMKDIVPRSSVPPKCSNDGYPPECSDDNVAINSICDTLIQELAEGSGDVLPPKPRSVCYHDRGQNKDCCVSWHNQQKSTLTKGDLLSPVRSIQDTCQHKLNVPPAVSDAIGYVVSGSIYFINLAETCTRVCLSGRGTYC